MTYLARAVLGFFAAAFLLCNVAWASESRAAQEQKLEAILKEAEKSTVYGPATVALGDQATIKIRKGEGFLNKEITKKIFSVVAPQQDSSQVMGMLIPGLPGDEKPKDDWGLVAIIFKPDGYVKDEDAKSWKLDQLLSHIQGSTAKANEARAERGMPPREVTGWVDAPHYDADTHRFLFSYRFQDIGKPESADVIFNSFALGREGTLFFVYGTKFADLSKRRDLAAVFLQSIQFNPGKRYEDFRAGEDKVAAFGLAALVTAGAAAHKMGWLALMVAAVVKWGKLLAIGGGLLVFFKLRKKNKKTEP